MGPEKVKFYINSARLYQIIGPGHYRPCGGFDLSNAPDISVTIPSFEQKSQFEEIFGEELKTESLCSAIKNFIEKSNEMKRSLNRMADIICKANEDATSRLRQSLNAYLDRIR